MLEKKAFVLLIGFMLIVVIPAGLITMIYQNAHMAAQNEQLEISITKMNQAWLNSKESTLSGLEIERDLKTDYQQNFIEILQLRNKKKNAELDKNLPKDLIKLLEFPPQKVSPDVNKV